MLEEEDKAETERLSKLFRDAGDGEKLTLEDLQTAAVNEAGGI